MAKPRKAGHRKRPAGRAQRFPIQAPVRYRVDKGPWHRGTTENISRSGVLLHSDDTVTPNTNIELVVELPAVLPGEAVPLVICRGRVVRTQEGDDVDGMTFAAAILSYRLDRDDLDAIEPDRRQPN